MLEAARRARSSPDHVLLSGPPGLGKTTMAMIIAAEIGAPLRVTSGPAIQHAGDLAAILSGLGERRRVVPRRDPPDVPAGRGDALHGDGGLPGRRRGRQGARRDGDPAGDPAVHARRCDHSGRAVAGSAARPVRLHRPSRVLRDRRAAAHRRPDRPGCSRSTIDADGGCRDRVPLSGDPADRQPTAPPGARLRPGPQRRARRPGRSPRTPSRSSRSTSPVSTGSTGRCSMPCAGGSAVDRWGSARWRSPSARSARRSRRSPSRSSCAVGTWRVRRAAGWRRRLAWEHLSLPVPAGRPGSDQVSLFDG